MLRAILSCIHSPDPGLHLTAIFIALAQYCHILGLTLINRDACG